MFNTSLKTTKSVKFRSHISDLLNILRKKGEVKIRKEDAVDNTFLESKIKAFNQLLTFCQPDEEPEVTIALLWLTYTFDETESEEKDATGYVDYRKAMGAKSLHHFLSNINFIIMENYPKYTKFYPLIRDYLEDNYFREEKL